MLSKSSSLTRRWPCEIIGHLVGSISLWREEFCKAVSPSLLETLDHAHTHGIVWIRTIDREGSTSSSSPLSDRANIYLTRDGFNAPSVALCARAVTASLRLMSFAEEYHSCM